MWATVAPVGVTWRHSAIPETLERAWHHNDSGALPAFSQLRPIILKPALHETPLRLACDAMTVP
jgi:hypothetical protein